MTEPAPPPSPTPSRPSAPSQGVRARRTLVACVAVVFGMLGASYAAVPLYRLFCQVTGFGGTPMVASRASSEVGERRFTVRFDSNVAPGVAWRFEPETPTVDVKVGETVTVFYKLTNTGTRATAGIASFNVLPEMSGAYFNKLQCFCFNEITLQPGESLEAPVVFFIDPEIAKVKEMAGTSVITLSYTIFAAKTGPKPVAGVAEPGAPKL